MWRIRIYGKDEIKKILTCPGDLNNAMLQARLKCEDIGLTMFYRDDYKPSVGYWWAYDDITHVQIIEEGHWKLHEKKRLEQ